MMPHRHAPVPISLQAKAPMPLIGMARTCTTVHDRGTGSTPTGHAVRHDEVS